MLYNDKNEVAVLVSPGHGSGWSTYNEADFAIDERIVELVLDYGSARNVPRKELVNICLTIIEEKYGYEAAEDYHLNLLGWNRVVIEWVPRGTYFRIAEYDGAESIETLDIGEWWQA